MAARTVEPLSRRRLPLAGVFFAVNPRNQQRGCGMPVADVVSLISRWLHIMAAATAVGGTVFALLVVLPAAGVLAPDAREAFHAAARRRWSKIVMGAIAILLVTGLYNFITIKHNYKLVLPRWYDPIFGLKFLLAFAVFAIASLLVGRTAHGPAAARQCPTLALGESPDGGIDRCHLGSDANDASRHGSGCGGRPGQDSRSDRELAT